MTSCSMCKQSFDISVMRKSATINHSKGKRHLEKMNNRNSISPLFSRNSIELNRAVIAKPSTEIPCSSNHRSGKTATNLTSFVLTIAVTKAEILWCLKTAVSHSLFHLCETISSIFSDIVSSIFTATLRKTFPKEKQNLHILWILALRHFSKTYYQKNSNLQNILLFPRIKLNTLSVNSFKWSHPLKQFVGNNRWIVWVCLTIFWGWCLSLNAILKEEQMNILVRFFNEAAELAETRYFDSPFLKHPKILIFYKSQLAISHICHI